MSMFNLVIGNTGWPMELMEAVGLRPSMVARYRDHWMEHDGDDDLVLAVYTRLGGGNRSEYAEQLAAMHALPTFISDDDDSFDDTYCTLRFRLSKKAFVDWMQDLEDKAGPAADRPSHNQVWSELWDAAEPLPRDMGLIWRATLQMNGADTDAD